MSVPLVEPLASGTLLGKYRLLSRLAVGGMAEIYLALSGGIKGFEKYVVIKRILPQLSAQKNYVTMFLDEARLAASLQHANIAQVYDVGEQDGSFFFTMEYVHGVDLRALLDVARENKEPIPIDYAITIAVDVAAGLHYAHEHADAKGEPLGLVHRDVSPSNVLVSYDGCVKLVDFGVAKATTQQSETRDGSIKGKLRYMSPEQVRGEPLDRRSDIFSLGILIYELTTGSALFEGNDLTVMNLIAFEDAPKPSLRFPAYPAELERIVLKALSRDRQQRYDTAEAMQLELEEWARRSQISLSTANLAHYIERTFGDRMRDADQARKEGTLADFLARRMSSQAEERLTIDIHAQQTTPAGKKFPRPQTNVSKQRAVVVGLSGLLLVATLIFLFWWMFLKPQKSENDIDSANTSALPTDRPPDKPIVAPLPSQDEKTDKTLTGPAAAPPTSKTPVRPKRSKKQNTTTNDRPRDTLLPP